MGRDFLINGILVDSGLLNVLPMSRCIISECQAQCCAGGVYVSLGQADDIMDHTSLIQPHLSAERRNTSLWFDDKRVIDEDHPGGGMVVGTQVLPDSTHPAGETCVFLREDRKCALQVAGISSGFHQWRFKPFYCAMHPLVYDKKRLVLSEESDTYKEGGSCNRSDPGQNSPLYQLFEIETKLALGNDGYEALKRATRQM